MCRDPALFARNPGDVIRRLNTQHCHASAVVVLDQIAVVTGDLEGRAVCSRLLFLDELAGKRFGPMRTGFVDSATSSGFTSESAYNRQRWEIVMAIGGTLPFRDLARARLASRQPLALDLGDWMPAAVLVLVYPRDGDEHVLLTVRTELVEHHKGQISLPGGAVDESDADLESTALRETFEEVGIVPDEVEVLGRLDDILTVSRYRVTPVVGVLDNAPHGFTPSPFEVAEVLEVPLIHLLDPANYIEERRDRNGILTVSPGYEFEGHRVWGATAKILYGFLGLLVDA